MSSYTKHNSYGNRIRRPSVDNATLGDILGSIKSGHGQLFSIGRGSLQTTTKRIPPPESTVDFIKGPRPIVRDKYKDIVDVSIPAALGLPPYTIKSSHLYETIDLDYNEPVADGEQISNWAMILKTLNINVFDEDIKNVIVETRRGVCLVPKVPKNTRRGQMVPIRYEPRPKEIAEKCLNHSIQLKDRPPIDALERNKPSNDKHRTPLESILDADTEPESSSHCDESVSSSYEKYDKKQHRGTQNGHVPSSIDRKRKNTTIGDHYKYKRRTERDIPSKSRSSNSKPKNKSIIDFESDSSRPSRTSRKKTYEWLDTQTSSPVSVRGTCVPRQTDDRIFVKDSPSPQNDADNIDSNRSTQHVQPEPSLFQRHAVFENNDTGFSDTTESTTPGQKTTPPSNNTFSGEDNNNCVTEGNIYRDLLDEGYNLQEAKEMRRYIQGLYLSNCSIFSSFSPKKSDQHITNGIEIYNDQQLLTMSSSNIYMMNERLEICIKSLRLNQTTNTCLQWVGIILGWLNRATLKIPLVAKGETETDFLVWWTKVTRSVIPILQHRWTYGRDDRGQIPFFTIVCDIMTIIGTSIADRAMLVIIGSNLSEIVASAAADRSETNNATYSPHSRNTSS